MFLFCCCMCGLPGHTYNECLVFFGKPGARGVLFRSIAQYRNDDLVTEVQMTGFVSYHLLSSFFTFYAQNC
jgi:hypothetical protein